MTGSRKWNRSVGVKHTGQDVSDMVDGDDDDIGYTNAGGLLPS